MTNIDIANLAFDTTRIFTGSVTASVDRDGFFRVEDSEGPIKSEFSGSVYVSSSLYVNEFIYGDGTYITNVTAQASPRIQSGSVYAEVNPDQGLVVYSPASGSEFTGSVDITGSISASLFRGDGSGLFNIPLESLQDLQLNKINSGSGEAIIDPDKLFVNVPITASRYDGDGSGLFNIPAESLQDLKLDRIESGSAVAVISPNFGIVTNVGLNVSGSLITSGGLFVTGGDVLLSSGSSFVGDGSGLTNINIANLAFETFILKSGSVTASVSPDKGFVTNTSASIWGSLYVDDVIQSTTVTSSYVFAPLHSGSFLGTYTFQGAGPTASAEYDILRYDDSRGYYVPQPELSLTETVSFTEVDELTIVHNLDILYPVVQIYELGSQAQIIPASIESIDSNTIRITFSGLTSVNAVIGSGGSVISGTIQGDRVVGTVNSASYAVFAETAASASSVTVWILHQLRQSKT